MYRIFGTLEDVRRDGWARDDTTRIGTLTLRLAADGSSL